LICSAPVRGGDLGWRMTVILKTMDQVPGASSVHGPELSFRSQTVTARDIVRARVEAEVERYNNDEERRPFVGLVAPAEAERELNGPARQRRRPLDAERQIEVALEAIRKSRVILMFNGVQVEDIDAPLLITPVSEARFLKLVPLVGG
jgi:hypothetical protein